MTVTRRALLGGGAALLGAAALGGPAEAATGSAWSIGQLGDSLTANGSNGSVGDVRTGGRTVFTDLSYLGQALPLTRGRFRFSGTWAAPGLTSTEIVAKLLPSVVAARPRCCIVLVGTNDVSRVPLDESRANVRTILARLRAAGVLPILSSIPPGDLYTSEQQAQADAFNGWIKPYAAANKVPFVDFHAATVDPGTRRWRPGNTSDGGHPNGGGARLMGRALAGVLNAIPGPVPTPLLSSYAPRGALLADVLHSRSGTWSLSGNPASGSYSRVRTSHWTGAKGTLTSGPFADVSVIGRLSRQPTPGHRIRFASVLDARYVPVGATWSCQLVERNYTLPLCGYTSMSQPLTNADANPVMAWEFTMPQLLGGSEVVVQYRVQGPANCVLGLAQTSVVDLTALDA